MTTQKLLRILAAVLFVIAAFACLMVNVAFRE